MESTVSQGLEGHSVFLTEDDIKTEYNPDPVLDPLFIRDELELPQVKQESMSEDLLDIEEHPVTENLLESDAIKQEPTSPPGTPTHSIKLDNIFSQLDQATHESSKTQLQFDFTREVYIKSESKVNQCFVCNKAFSRKKYLRQHLLFHSDKRDHQCDKCGKCFTTRGSLKTHQQTHEQCAYICTNCNKTFTFKQSLARHIKQQHMCGSDIIRYACPICSKSYSTNGHLTAHMKTHNLQHCKICNLECINVPELRTHMKVAHEDQKIRQCKTCEKLFFTLEDLKLHEKYHTKSFKCSHCSERFLTNDRLDLHVKNQHSITQYDCDFCSKSCTSKRSLRKHKLSHSKPEQCNICDRAFCYKYQLNHHISGDH